MNDNSQGIARFPGRGDVRVGRRHCMCERLTVEFDGGSTRQVMYFGPFADGEAVKGFWLFIGGNSTEWTAATPSINDKSVMVNILSVSKKGASSSDSFLSGGLSFCGSTADGLDGVQLNFVFPSQFYLPIAFVAGRDNHRWLAVRVNSLDSYSASGSVWLDLASDPNPLGSDVLKG